jgi:MFS family permease
VTFAPALGWDPGRRVDLPALRLPRPCSARQTLGATDALTSLLYAGSGLGLLVGFVLLARRGSWGAPAAVATMGLAWSSAGNLLTGLAPVLAVAFVMQVVRGGGLSLVDVGTTTLVQRSVPRDLRGRAFANLYGGVGLAAAVSYAAGGPLLDLLSPRGLLVIAGGILTSAAVALRVLHRPAWRDDTDAPISDPDR